MHDIALNTKRLIDDSKFIIKKPFLMAKIIKNCFKLSILRKRVLRSVDLAVDFACQCKCSQCSVSRMHDPEKKKLTLNQIKQLIDDSLLLGAIDFRITGGEPLLRKDIFDIISYIKSKGVFISLLTNGILLTEDNVQKLKKSGLDLVAVSLDSINPDKHDKNRGIKGLFDRAIRGIESARKADLFVLVDVVITRELITTGEIWSFVKLARSLGAILQLVIPCAVGNWTNKYENLLREEDLKIVRDLLKIRGVRSDAFSAYLNLGCPAGSERTYITPYGDVIPCPFIHISFGNILEERLERIWKKMYLFPRFNQTKPLCLAGEDREFIRDYLVPLANEETLPLHISRHPKFPENKI